MTKSYYQLIRVKWRVGNMIDILRSTRDPTTSRRVYLPDRSQNRKKFSKLEMGIRWKVVHRRPNWRKYKTELRKLFFIY